MKRLVCCFMVFYLLILCSCNTDIPELLAMTPGSKVFHMPSFTLTITGNNFNLNSLIVFNNVEKATDFINNVEISCTINPADISSGPASLPVLIRNPGTGGGDSNIAYFTVRGAHTFTTPVVIHNNQSIFTINFCDLAIDNSKNLNISWHEGSPPGLEAYCYFSRSTDLGITWTTPQIIGPPATWGNFYPAIGLDNSGNINVLLTKQFSSGGLYDIYHIRSTNGGGSWSTPLNITSALALESSKYSELVIDNSGKINVFFDSWGNFYRDIYFMDSNDSGNNWSAAAPISSLADWAIFPEAAMDQTGNINVVWLEIESNNQMNVLFSRSTNSGSTWTAKSTVASNISYFPPHITVDDLGFIYILWRDETASNYYMYLQFSQDGGVTWSSPYTVANSSTEIWAYFAADNAGNVNILYYENGVYFKRSTDRGSTWHTSISLPANVGYGFAARLALDNEGNIYIVNRTDSGNGIIFCRSDH